MDRVPTRERLDQVGTRRGRRIAAEFVDEIRAARLAAGLSQASVGRALGWSKAKVSRLETGTGRAPDFVAAARIAQIVGLDLSVRCYQSGARLRDAAHLALIGRLVRELHTAIGRVFEAPMPTDRDQRAWDLLLRVEGVTIGVAAETRLRDVQALLRLERAKQRDSAATRLLLVVSDTRANRAALREHHALLGEALPLSTRQVLRALRSGTDPGADGVVMI